MGTNGDMENLKHEIYDINHVDPQGILRNKLVSLAFEEENGPRVRDKLKM